MKRFTFISSLVCLALCVFALPIYADEVCDAQGLYEQLNAQTTGDVLRCEQAIQEPNIKNCPLPLNFSGAQRPASQIVFLMGSSGSMGEILGNRSKISIVKVESLRFLKALQEEVPTGMIVYGHKGDNTKADKAEYCSAVEWAHDLNTPKSQLEQNVNSLKPGVYTPLANA